MDEEKVYSILASDVASAGASLGLDFDTFTPEQVAWLHETSANAMADVWWDRVTDALEYAAHELGLTRVEPFDS